MLTYSFEFNLLLHVWIYVLFFMCNTTCTVLTAAAGDGNATTEHATGEAWILRLRIDL